MNKRHVALIGFMAAGKSTIGQRVAREMALPFIDTDARIVAAHGAIEEIFAREGEARFREYERATVEAALQGEDAVISLGGGAVTYEPTRALLNEHAIRVFIEVPAGMILARARRSTSARPLLGAQPSLERIRKLLALREPYYREAEIIVSGKGSVGKVAQAIVFSVKRSRE